ncbi:MAG: helicase-related protein, partial [Planctomycetota bacterium]
EEIARLLGGAEATADPNVPPVPRPVEIVDASEPKKLELRIEVPVEDMARLGDSPAGRSGNAALGPGNLLGEPQVPLPLLGEGLGEGAAPPLGTPEAMTNAMLNALGGEVPNALGGEVLDEDYQGFDSTAGAPPPPAPPPAGGGEALALAADPTGPSPPSIWPAIHPRLLELVRQHRSTMIFVNSRRLAERLAQALNELANEDTDASGGDQSDTSKTRPVEIAMAHHGSIAKDKRAAIEDRLKRGQLPAIVATSSLELGIDMGAVDLVIQIEAPPTIASGMQRIGRSGHSVGAVSRGRIFPKYRGDLLACAAAAGRMLIGHVEETFYPRNPVDLLAQQIVAMVSRGAI